MVNTVSHKHKPQCIGLEEGGTPAPDGLAKQRRGEVPEAPLHRGPSVPIRKQKKARHSNSLRSSRPVDYVG
ncbi:hypothetical protein THAOC_19621 [Thalassiosira oceanica]|uniref:Uncharacterized protein n=1 Tax=Thalassiosira oceanica TaxID=159749 RepID=K0SGJ2_THAOC|nr:hypothetical protein THAOC_19621 [Thalassiosira oceanica]|eukprot:EJK60091.1 hypothetical protein THAOC_19621 [Thalassiosira oceanica]